ncbi:sensor histidine kinase [Paenibacillus psychroresistens]|uniref:histidine kinase n=1 Tax=Paenibacillus psychroresistens TaxID=1778678 RepID=A0A6B8RSI8_9BACL|nr:sensor histidine kinase [Paenibacillus psychroresistens]QGQ98877.1 sensor histidine kinase [Paenibacillus psychroresistens]
MSFIRYVLDKRYFLVLYVVLMLFVSLIMLVSVNHQHAINNLLYTNITCLFFVCCYLTAGYYYRNSYYDKLKKLIANTHEDTATALPEPQNYEQALYIDLLKKLHSEHSNRLQKLHAEKRDHQDFIMSWIHEVKLPIASSRLLMEHSTGKSVDYMVDKLEDELNKIDNYVEQALYYSRIDTFSKDYFITETLLDQIIKESIKKYAKLFINKRIRFKMYETPQFIQTDSKWLGFIIDQIIANALKYTGDGGEILISFEEDQLEKRLLLIDSGIGIKPEDIQRVFEKGFTGSSGRSFTKSTGMGLYLALQLSIKLDHRLSIQSEEGKYTKLIIHFPKIRNYFNM